MKKCPTCGIIYPDRDNLCHKCGDKLEIMYENGKFVSSSSWKENDHKYDEQFKMYCEYKDNEKSQETSFDSKSVGKAFFFRCKKAIQLDSIYFWLSFCFDGGIRFVCKW